LRSVAKRIGNRPYFAIASAGLREYTQRTFRKSVLHSKRALSETAYSTVVASS
jgi:hypothetical protein